jgi:hypothetical protein
MGKNSYLGGSSIDGPGAAYFRTSSEDGNAPRDVRGLQGIMREQDQLRANGISPIGHLKALAKKAKTAKIKRGKLKAEIKSLKKELEEIRAKRNAD